MKIKDERKTTSYNISNIPLGGLFKFGDRFFIKTFSCSFSYEDRPPISINCIDVKSGYLSHVNDDANIEYFPDAFISVRNN